MFLRRALTLATGGILAMVSMAPAMAESSDGERNDKDEMIAAVSAPVPLGQAIAAAEKATSGRAVSARYDGTDGGTVIKVELVKDQAIVRVRVDRKSGEPLTTTAGTAEEHAEDDDEE